MIKHKINHVKISLLHHVFFISDYSKIADHVCAVKKMKKTNIFQALLATYCDPIVSTIDPGEILDHLLQRETIT